MAFFDVVEWKPKSNDIFAWRFPNSNLSTASQLIVRESQEAVLFSKGEIIGKFGPGKHKLSTENLPVLRNLYGIPFGGTNPFTAEVWFVNKTVPLTIDWKTTPMRFMDPDYNQMMPLIASGRYGLRVAEAEKFLVQLVGTLSSFTSAELTNHFLGELISKTNSAIISFMTVNGIGINKISMHLSDLSKFISEPMAEFWKPYGFLLTGFYVTSVDLDISTPDGKKIANALSDRSAQAIAGYTWQQNKTFGIADNAINNLGNGSGGMGLIGVAMMAGAFGGNSGGTGAAMTPPGQNQYEVNQGGNRAAKGEVFCSNCAKKYPISSKFCPYCGDPYMPCPVCGADNDSNAKRCVSCGAYLQQQNFTVGNNCSKCGSPVTPGVKFCPNCGNKLN